MRGAKAVDVTVVSTEARDPEAEDDHLKAAFVRKTKWYAEIAEEWEDTGPRFLPMVWGHQGRAHPEVARNEILRHAHSKKKRGPFKKM